MKYNLDYFLQQAFPESATHLLSKSIKKVDFLPISVVKYFLNSENSFQKRMEYHTDGHLKYCKIDNFKYCYQQNVDNNIKEALIFKGKGLVARHRYTYTPTGELKEIFKFGGHNQKLLKLHSFQYNSQHQLIRHSLYLTEFNDYLFTCHYHWKNNNIAAKTSVNRQGHTSRTEYTFDEHINPLRRHPLFVKSTKGWNQNNIIHTKKTSQILGQLINIQYSDYQYQFNRQNRVIEMKNSDGDLLEFQYLNR